MAFKWTKNRAGSEEEEEEKERVREVRSGLEEEEEGRCAGVFRGRRPRASDPLQSRGCQPM